MKFSDILGAKRKSREILRLDTGTVRSGYYFVRTIWLFEIGVGKVKSHTSQGGPHGRSLPRFL